MKKFILFCMALLMVGMGMTQNTQSAEAVFSKDEAVRERFALKREKLAEVVSKKVAHVENSIKKKLKVQEEKKVKKQKEENEKKAAAKKAEEEKVASQQAAAQAIENEQAAATEQIEEQPIEQAQVPVAPENPQGAEAVSGASASGREIGQKNREWGEQLSDPNLTPEERQGIIQEKKNYNRNNH
ncbi:hypothetical protein UAY_00507 [Enterococcus moraviensis ATCC BAA-383]|uniref:Lipoprotein n=1 Tax=Enterococcus moraviensis ATCC BAA-383 TaxID=1158609 RepID=R2TCJ1_9ENTE|nr:hypothetical protein [Enterococcus moraviensis]EOI05033.1 hypothetical protein UAY_00507 [Enterococcus moraviensis ATCC BAA-383]EOT63816.1 hypothetical protein I586_03249 [Enterococcus moraviensis ATCC BAA-383]